MGAKREPDDFPSILRKAVCSDHAAILRLLLMAEGTERMSRWANAELGGMRMLHFGAASCCAAAVEVLLASGANEGARNRQGARPGDIIGADLGMMRWMCQEKAATIRRLLKQGPAYRARLRARAADKAVDACRNAGEDTPPGTAAPDFSRSFQANNDSNTAVDR